MAAVGSTGAVFARKGYLTPEICKANASLIMNFLLPLLMFSTVLPAFNTGNMDSVLAVAITGIFYQVLGLSFGLIVRWFTPTPKSWGGGVLAAGLRADPVIRGMGFLRFNLGGLQLIKRDFDHRPEVLLDVEKSAKTPPKSINSALAGSARKAVNVVSRLASARQGTPSVPGGKLSCELNPRMTSSSEGISSSEAPTTPAIPPETATTVETLGRSSSSSTARHLDTQITIATTATLETPNSQAPTIADPPSASPPTPIPILLRVWAVLKPLLTLPALTLVFSLVIANVPYLKALFVDTPTVSKSKIPNAPDNKPPLDFMMDIATFSGPCVPVLGMLLIGAALSRLSMNNLPKGFWKAALLMALLKLVLGPIIGIAWTTQLKKRTNWIDPNDKILEFVMIISSGAPTATTQVYLTNVFAPLGEECLEMSALSA
ncbi:hypothetical protein HOY82DRAFT_596959 [Tuber indicum]|nr:hypothetical protein HOY82DRAFT_596959 [Tuber indicum]